jgi:hypothetical protein
VSPTIFRAAGLRFFFFSREDERIHVHVLGEEGEAKVWIEPRIELTRNHGLGGKTLATALDLITEREDEIRRAWDEQFGR